MNRSVSTIGDQNDCVGNSQGRPSWARQAFGVIGVIVLVWIKTAFALDVMDIPLAAHLDTYDVSKGAMFPFGLLWMAFAPVVADGAEAISVSPRELHARVPE